MSEKRLITAAEAARRVGVSTSTMTRWIAKGKVPALRTPGGHFRIRAADVSAILGDALLPSGKSPQA